MSRARVSVAAQAPSRYRVAAAFGQVLRALREDAGLSQEAFAELAGMDRSTPSTYERGLRQPTLSYLFVIACVLGTQPERLVSDTRARLESS
jgi:transcriptional regulator with XRE-family HTH domain